MAFAWDGGGSDGGGGGVGTEPGGGATFKSRTFVGVKSVFVDDGDEREHRTGSRAHTGRSGVSDGRVSVHWLWRCRPGVSYVNRGVGEL